MIWRDWLPAPETTPRGQVVRTLNQRLQLLAAQLRDEQARLDDLKQRVTVLEGP